MDEINSDEDDILFQSSQKDEEYASEKPVSFFLYLHSTV